jgi:hypothetical protein
MRTIKEIKADIAETNAKLAEFEADPKSKDNFNIQITKELIKIKTKEAIEALINGIPLDRLEAICQAEREGRIVILPHIKLYKTLYWIWGDEIMPVKYMGIHHGVVDKNKIYHVVCRMHTKNDRTFYHRGKPFTYKAGDERWFYADDIGKTVFLTRKAAKQALKEA